MKKRNLGVLALSSVLAFGAVGLTLTTLAGCGQQASFGELTVETVGDQEYGSTVDLKPLVRFDGKADETKTITVTVVTTTTLQKVGGDTGTSVRVIGVGACEVKVACEGKEVSVTFNAVPVIGGISVQPLTYAMVGQTVNLDDLVTVTVTAPVTATAEYKAEVVTTDTVELGSDGKTLTFKATGAYKVNLSVPGSEHSTKLEGTVVSQTEGKVRQLLNGIGTNYSALVLGSSDQVIAKALHNDNYNVLVSTDVSGSIRFIGGKNTNGYFFNCKLDDQGLADVSTIEYEQANTSAWSNYFVNMPFDSTVLDSFELVENEGEDPYLFARTGVDVQNDTLYSTLVYGSIFQDASEDYDAIDIKILPSVLDEVEVVKVELTGVTINSGTQEETTEEYLTYVLTGVGTTVEPNLEEFVSDPANEPLPPDPTAEMSFLATAKAAKNYTVEYSLGIFNYYSGLPFTASTLPSTLAPFADLAFQQGVTYIDDETMYREASCYLNYPDETATPLNYGYTVGEDGLVHDYSKDEGGTFVVGDVISDEGTTYTSIYDILYTLNDYMDGYSETFVTSARTSDGTLTYTIDDSTAQAVLSTLGLIGLASERMCSVFGGLSFTSGATVLNTAEYSLTLDAVANTMGFSAQSTAINFGDGVAVLLVDLTITEVGTTVIE